MPFQISITIAFEMNNTIVLSYKTNKKNTNVNFGFFINETWGNVGNQQSNELRNLAYLYFGIKLNIVNHSFSLQF